MKKLSALCGLLLLGTVSLQAQDQYTVSIDLTGTENDLLPVEVQLPPIAQDSIEYHMPKIVPGTYAVYDFGRFVTEFKASDADGNPIAVDRLTDNRWLIKDARKAAKVSYMVEDTWDTEKENFIFEPGGTSYEYDKQVYMLNTHGFIGYLEGMKNTKYVLNVKKQPGLFAATSLEALERSEENDHFSSPSYHELADAPVMYSKPDTITRNIGGAEVLVSVFSPEGKLSAAFVMDEILPILEAQKEYLGGTLPVDRYAFLIYLFNGRSGSGGYGALEHSYSSLYFLPEMDPETIAQTVRDVAAHEFFHIVTPLSIHSEEIGDFDFIDPKMSQHLWLYEGVTEYSAMHVQVKYGLTSKADFLEVVKEKLRIRDRFPKDLPFTKMSADILGEYADYYANVYYKGALIGLCLDIKLLSLSDGKYDLQMLMRDLAKEYGKNTSFRDEALFDKIEALTYPEIGDFLRRYVGGSEELPIADMLKMAGISYQPEAEVAAVTLGGIGFNLNDDEQIYIDDLDEINAFGEEIGYAIGDIILSVQGQALTLASFQNVVQDFRQNTEEGDKVIVEVLRDVKGKLKKKKLKAKAQLTTRTVYHVLDYMENLTEEQKAIQKAWLGND